MGIIALGDPVFNLKARDDLIGWNANDRGKRLVNLLDAYVLGAVPPYNMILGGKLVSCLVRSREVRDDFARRYGKTRGVISRKKKEAKLVMVTTSSSLGRSSVYNRLKLDNENYFTSIGYTQGWGHFHVPNILFDELRDYLRKRKHKYVDGQPRPSRQCNGMFHNVYLGHVFATDLLLMRMTVQQPMATDTNNLVVLRALEDALYSIAEALRLAASRHPQLDLDPSEFGAGFRIVPSGNAEGQLFLDIYLYDTLSGGAGYAELAGRHLNDILRDVLQLLENCPAHCDRSCESCLCHYHNQHLRDRLDRFVGAQMLRFALSGEIPRETPLQAQAENLEGLARLLELDGFRCTRTGIVEGQTVPLLVERNGTRAVIGVKSALLSANWDGHSLHRLLGTRRIAGRVLNDYILRRNLPDEHQLIRSMWSV